MPNALDTTLPATKTIFHPQADTSQKKRQKNDVPMTIYICSLSHDIPGISDYHSKALFHLYKIYKLQV